MMPFQTARLILRLANNPKILTACLIVLLVQILTPYVFLWAIVTSYAPEMLARMDNMISNTNEIKTILMTRS